MNTVLFLGGKMDGLIRLMADPLPRTVQIPDCPRLSPWVALLVSPTKRFSIILYEHRTFHVEDDLYHVYTHQDQRSKDEIAALIFDKRLRPYGKASA